MLQIRTSALLLLLLHLTTFGVGPLVDAHAEVTAATHLALHVEDADAPLCDPGHHPDHCLICRALQSYDTPSHEASILVAEIPQGDLTVRDSASPRATSVLSPLGPRAPPLA